MTSSHLDPERLADLQEGLLEPKAAGAATAHLAGCAQCQADHAALQRVTDLLSAAPDAGPMPPEVAARIDAALAAETTLVGPDPVSTPEAVTASPTVTPLQPRRPKPALSTRLLQAAAVVVVLMAGAGIAVSAFLQGGGSSDTSASGGAVSESAAQPDADDRAADAPTIYVATGADYTPESVAAAAPRLLAAGEVTARTGSNSAPEAYAGAPQALRDLAPGAGLDACVNALAGAPTTPLLVDLAKFRGEPAAVVILPTEGDRATMDVWVVSPDCSPADAKLRYFARVARP